MQDFIQFFDMLGKYLEPKDPYRYGIAENPAYVIKSKIARNPGLARMPKGIPLSVINLMSIR